MNDGKGRPQGKLTPEHIAQIKSAISEQPDISLNQLIQKLSLPVTASGLCHRLKRDNIPYKKRFVFTKAQNALIRAAFKEKPDITPSELIAKYSFPVTGHDMRRKLTNMGLMPKARTALTDAQIAQIKAELTEHPDMPVSELIVKLSLPVKTAGLRNKLRKMGIPYKGQRGKQQPKKTASAETTARKYDEHAWPLTTTPHYFIGTKPAAVQFGTEVVEVKTWREVYAVVLKRCNDDPKGHEMLMYLRNKVAGKVRVFLSDKPDGMTRPHRIDTDLYGEIHYGTETLMHILVNHLLKWARFDCSNVSIVIKFK